MEKMTRKVAFTMAQDALNTIDTTEAKQAWDILQKEIEKLEKAALRAKTNDKPTKADLAKAEFRGQVMVALTNHDAPVRAGELAAEMGDVSTQKVSAALTALVKSGAVVKTVEHGNSFFSVITNTEDGPIEG